MIRLPRAKNTSSRKDNRWSILTSHTTHAMGCYDTLTYCGRLPARLGSAVHTPPFRLRQITCLVCKTSVRARRHK